MDGTHHVAPISSQRALLTALKVPHATAGDIRHGLRERHRATTGGMLPPTVLVREGTAARVPVRPGADGGYHSGIAQIALDPATSDSQRRAALRPQRGVYRRRTSRAACSTSACCRWACTN